MIKNPNNLQGRKFGRLTVLRDSGKRQKYSVMWACLCLCGRLKEVRQDHLKSKRIRSCGCIKKEQASIHLKKIMEKNKEKHHSRYKHGGTGTKLHNIWRAIKARCFNANTNRYKYFGGRGITICSEWKDNYKAFKFWAILSGYRDGLTIDRIDSNGNYKPENCQWMTKSDHSKKTRLRRL